MKKIFSILLVFIVLVVSLNLTLATHFCEGRIADVKIGLNGTTASCGMENVINNNSDTHSALSPAGCCKNASHILSVDNYQVSSRLEIQKTDLKLLEIFLVPVFHFLNIPSFNTFYFTDVGTDHPLMSLSERLTFICVFRK